MSGIDLFLNDELLDYVVSSPVMWNPEQQAHMLVFGGTGSGKTYAVKLLLGKIALRVPNARITLCDYKADDFRFLEGCERYYSFNACTEGLNRFYKAFTDRQEGKDPKRNFMLLVFDEWASYLTMQEKKQAEEAKQKLSTLLMLGRSFNVHVLISQQRPDAEYFAKARDNFGVVIALGNLSKESKSMFFSEFSDELRPVYGQGVGYMLTAGARLQRIRVPRIRDMERLERAIRGITEHIEVGRGCAKQSPAHAPAGGALT